jgi:hypothetical protein
MLGLCVRQNKNCRPEFLTLGVLQVRDGKTGSGRPALSAELALAIDARWKDVVGQATGCDTYQSLRDLASKECAKQTSS